MKKWLNLILITILAMTLAACGDSAEPAEEVEAETETGVDETSAENETDENEEAEDEEADEENDEEQAAKEIYEKAIQAAESLESSSSTLMIEQNMSSPNGEEDLHSVTEGEVELTTDPLTMYEKLMIDGEADGEDVETIVEMYITEDAFYFYDETLDEWIKTDTSVMGDINDMAIQGDPSEQLKQIEQFMSGTEVEENDDEYILTVEADGDAMMDMVEEMLGGIMPPELMQEMAAEGIDIFEQMTINHMTYNLTFDKETFDLLHFELDSDMDLEVDGETGNISQMMEVTYSDINELDPVEVPEEIEEAAIDEAEL